MKRTGKLCTLFMLVMLLTIVGLVGDSSLTAQFSGGPVNNTQNIQTFVLNSFEDPKEWRVDYSMYAAKKYNPSTKQFEIDRERNIWTNFVGKPWGVTVEGTNNRCLAVKASYDRKGYNWMEVYPAKPLPMIGRVEAIDVWVWGGNFQWRLEIHLLDYLGYKHIIDAGWLNFIGWRNIRLAVPRHIPQGERYVPRLKTLRFEKFVLFANPGEREDVFYVYFDRMQIQADVYSERFDGDDLVVKGTNIGWMPKQETLKQ
ncbi:MAG TPA: flagellar filament outer layer protein FlaA [Spirochaetota bacterium]|nr:flagellar filament outer layer protein FlaA [Spirochaetota bacterium]